jgi:hypothetical protein
MLSIIIVSCLFFTWLNSAEANDQTVNTHEIPLVFPAGHPDFITARLKLEATLLSGKCSLPDKRHEWESSRDGLRGKIINSAGVVFDHKLAADLKETGICRMQGYSIRNIYFQTLNGIYATANLYVPDGKGPFPAVLNLSGHCVKGKIDSTCQQAVGHILARNGYVCLTIDPWGSGERGTKHGVFEDHGDENNLGSALLPLGKTLLGIELSENIRAIDLLSSLSFVDRERIGVTGASGGGSQTMWLSALDDRIKAIVMVVSAGTFEAHVMGSPCICEVLSGALGFTEEAGVLSLIAPRALLIISHKRDDIPAFLPSEMLRSYQGVKSIYSLYNQEKKISYSIYDLPHGYWKEDREALIGWMDLYLKGRGDGSPVKESSLRQVAGDSLMVFSDGKRDPAVVSTALYCLKEGEKLSSSFLSTKEFDVTEKREGLNKLLGIGDFPDVKEISMLTSSGGWERYIFRSSDNKLLPVVIRRPSSVSNDFVIMTNPEGKGKIPAGLIDRYINSGINVVLTDLSGTGEIAASSPAAGYGFGRLRIINRSELLIGRTLMGEWTCELSAVASVIRKEFNASQIIMDGYKDTGLAGLFLGATGYDVDSILLRNSPVSYLFDTREGIDFFSNAVFIPDILQWGDISLIAALTPHDVEFIDPVTISGNRLSEEKYARFRDEISNLKSKCK